MGITHSSMVTSPTGKGVVLIGGLLIASTYGHSDFINNQKFLYELSGDSIEQLKWTKLDKKLKYGGVNSISVPISNHVTAEMEEIAKSGNNI